MMMMYDGEAELASDQGNWFEHAISGVTMKGRDGTDRQFLVSKLRKADELLLVREPENPYDPNAIMIQTPAGKTLGYVSAKPDEWWQLPGGLAAWLSRRLDAGETWRIFVRAVVGGDVRVGKTSVGCRVALVMIAGRKVVVKNRFPLKKDGSWVDDHAVSGEALALLGTAYRVWDELSENDRAYVERYAHGIRRFGGAPEEIHQRLANMVRMTIPL
jgi:HIRAN domain